MSVGCGSDGSPSTPTPTPEESTSDQVSEPVVDDLFTIGTSGLRAAMQCFGEGSPAIVLEAGTDSAGIERFATLIRSLAERNMTCTYDRLGTGLSDPRSSSDLDDLVAVLHELLDAAAVPGPYLLVGSSGGGLIVVHYAGRYPEEVAGLVLLDVASPAPDLAKEFPDEAGWDNVEHIDWFGAERQLALHSPPVEDIPVRIVTATFGDSNVKDQAVWLELSRIASQTTLEGEHVIYRDNPEGVVEEVQTTLEAIQAGE